MRDWLQLGRAHGSAEMRGAFHGGGEREVASMCRARMSSESIWRRCRIIGNPPL